MSPAPLAVRPAPAADPTPATPSRPVPVAITTRPLADDDLVVIGDLDELVETAMCSCDAGDDVPY
ncbi:hypothetical protein [Streptomyces chiangmaiensis]|uniref:Uncharacterized protein n=1 Tax=Streptomyces chiangmaiensis TaxID=766497 RepID=A0ABU7FQW7_9ACTN|nr:hypothetical protein [Streptomyces chiangmaiensis]MED7826147.1 hypothetical protein [Streptomyces chiangmaiensis]